MREEDFKLICKNADEVISWNGKSVYRVANSWLHITKEHPVLYSAYQRPARALILRLIGYLAIQIRYICKALWRGEGPELNLDSEVLLVTHLVNRDQLEFLKDPYFGDLNERVKAVSVFIDHIGLEKKIICGFNQKNTRKKILYPYLSFSQECRFLAGCLSDFLNILTSPAVCSATQGRGFTLRAAVEALSPNTFKALRIRSQIGAILRTRNFSSVITTYEGHSYERLIYQVARTLNPRIIRIGYHHPAVFKLEHASVRSLRDEFNPDIILCTGVIGQAQMLQKMGSPWAEVRVFGSHKVSEITYDPSRTCLVLPEGFPEESEFLLRFALEMARIKPKIHFVIRLHPRLKSSSFYEKFVEEFAMPINTSFSNRSFQDDIAQAKWAIYRGSTAIIEAAQVGVIPIYTYLEGQLHCDPLYELEQVLRVSSPATAGREIEALIRDKEVVDYCSKLYAKRELSALI